MSSRLDGRGRGLSFLSAHRCPEVDLLPPTHPQCSSSPVDINTEVTCTGATELDYLDVSPCRHSEEMEHDKDEEESISGWSEEDLSLHFSPSVILPSDEEQSDPESGFECVAVTVETQVKGQQGERLKMVPKRQIQLKKRDTESSNTDKRQVILKDSLGEGGGPDSDLSNNKLLCHPINHRPELLLRQHSMPTSFHSRTMMTNETDSFGVYKGLVAGASQGCYLRGNLAPRRLHKSFSLDETKTKMASCIIKNVLTKKMQGEQNTSSDNHNSTKSNTKPSNVQTHAVAVCILTPTDDQKKGREGGGARRAPVHVVRDVRSLLKNTYSSSFNNSKTRTQAEAYKPTTFKVVGQGNSPPPSYQQAVGVKGHQGAQMASKGFVAKVAAYLSQEQEERCPFSRPISQHRGVSGPITNRMKVDDDTWPELSQTKRIAPPPPSTIPHNITQGVKQPLNAQGQSSVPGVSTPSFPCSIQPVLSSCFYSPSTLPPHLGKLNYVQSPLSYIQTQLELQNLPPPDATFHLLHTSQSEGTGNIRATDHLKGVTRNRIISAGNSESSCNSPKQPSGTQRPSISQQQVLGPLPTQIQREFLHDVTGSTAVPRTLFNGPTPCHMMLDPQSGRCFYVDTPLQPQRKMLLDPETGQYIEVLLASPSPAPKKSFLAVCGTNSAPTMLNPTPAMLSVMQFQQPLGMSSLYSSPCLPFTLCPFSLNYTHTAP